MAQPKEPKKLEASKDILPYLKKAKDDRDALNKKLSTALPKDRASIKAEYETAKDQVDIYQEMYDDAKDREDDASKAIAGKSADVKLKQSGAQTRIKIAEDAVIASGKKSRNDPNDENKYNTYQNDMAALESEYNNFDAKGFVFPRIINSVEGGYVETAFAPATTAAATTMTGAEALAAEKGTATGVQDPATTIKSKVTVVKNGNNVEITTYMDGRVSEKVLGKSNLPDTAASNLPKDTSGNAASMKTYVDAQLKAKGLADTPVNRKTLRAAYQALTPEEKIAAVPAVPGAKTPPVVDNAWEQLFIKNNPAKAWYLTELDRAKYPQLFAILKEYALPRPLTVEEQAAFAAKLDGTDFFRELSTSGKIREIKKVVGDLGFDGSDFTKFVHTAINMGYTGDRLKEETYKEVFKKGDDGKYVNPIAFKRVIEGNDYLNVKLIGKQYFNEVSSGTIEKVLTGEIGSTDVQRQQRVLAGQKYQHLDSLLEQGLTLQDIAESYQTSASKLLEVDPNTIDMSAVDYEIALNFGEEGKKRIMTSGEWDRLLRTESKYGWEKTNNAKQEARGLASSLVQAFGRII
jgi:hypothetical protein